MFADTDENNVLKEQEGLSKLGYKTYITTDKPDYDLFDQRHEIEGISLFRSGTYEVVKDTYMYKDPLNKANGEICTTGTIIETKTSEIFNGYNESWIYIPDKNMYLCAEDKDHIYIFKK